MHSTIITVTWKGIGHVPVIIDSKGEILPVPLSWLISLCKQGSSQSTLRRNARGLKLFYDFWCQYAHQTDSTDLLRLFWKSLISGDPNLGWNAVDPDTAKAYLIGLNLFLDWLAEYTGSEHPNPLVEREKDWHSRVMEWGRRHKTDILAHLKGTKRTGFSRKINLTGSVLRRHTKQHRRPSAIFALDNFHKLLIHEDNSRDLILWLLLGPGGLRISEVLHLFVSDIVYDPVTHEARVRLADPVYGPITTKSLGQEIELTRQEFLRRKYQMIPRCERPQDDIVWAGWKGMKMHKPEEGESEVIWLHSFYGQMLWAAHVDYLRKRLATSPHHPWYLVNLVRNVGEPLTARNAAGLLESACKRLNLPPPHNPHSLRHMFGDITANVLKLSLQHIQVGLRHSSILSTMVYTEPSPNTVREALRRAKG